MDHQVAVTWLIGDTIGVKIPNDMTANAILKVKATKEREAPNENLERCCTKLVRKQKNCCKKCTINLVNNWATLNALAQNHIFLNL